MKRHLSALVGLIALTCGLATTQAAFIVETHTSGKANANFALVPGAGNATGATASVASTAPGLAGTNSIFGSNNNIADVVDVYRFSYTPGTDADNTVFSSGDALGNSAASDADGAGAGAPTYTIAPLGATGLTGGASGMYNVYFTAPASTNVSPAGSTFQITSDLADVVLNPVNLNNDGTGPDEVAGDVFTGGANNRWLKIATVELTAGNTYSVTVTSNVDGFVSQRAHAVMWEYAGAVIPEPSSIILVGLALFGSAMRRR